MVQILPPMDFAEVRKQGREQPHVQDPISAKPNLEYFAIHFQDITLSGFGFETEAMTDGEYSQWIVHYYEIDKFGNCQPFENYEEGDYNLHFDKNKLTRTTTYEYKDYAIVNVQPSHR